MCNFYTGLVYTGIEQNLSNVFKGARQKKLAFLAEPSAKVLTTYLTIKRNYTVSFQKVPLLKKKKLRIGSTPSL